MRNELEELKRLKNKPKTLYIICNYQSSEDTGIHWAMIYKNKCKNVGYYFCSYGLVPFDEAKDFLSDVKDRYANTFQIQPVGTKMCGQLFLFILFHLFKGEDFFDIILNNFIALK